MKNKILITLVIGLVVIVAGFFVASTFAGEINPTTDTVQTRSVSDSIVAAGSIHSENEATLHFQTGGKLTYLPFKKGDTVYQGQVVAGLDSYALQKQLEAALNSYRSTRDTFDQTKDNSQNGILFGQDRYTIEVPNKAAITTGDTENNIINDMIKRLIDQNQANLDNSVIGVQLAQYAVDLSSLVSPFNGILLSEDVTTPNVNITPATSFVIVDPNAKVFRADVSVSDIDFISVGSIATIKLDGSQKEIHGTVEKIYPQKIVLPSGQQVYEVDITADALADVVFGQNGSVLISSNNPSHALMVPTWTIINHNAVWVWDGKKAVLKKVALGQTHDDMTEVVNGLSEKDRVIVTPETVAKLQYSVL